MEVLDRDVARWAASLTDAQLAERLRWVADGQFLMPGDVRALLVEASRRLVTR